MDDIEHAYDLLEKMAESFAFCEDPYLQSKGYRKLTWEKHDYVFIYRVDGETVYLAGFFHMLENYRNKL